MKRDLDLMRAILLSVEEEHPGSGFVRYKFADEDFPGVENATLIGHFRLLIEDGLINSPTNGWLSNDSISVGNLTNYGYEILDTIRDKDIWDKTRENTANIKGLGIDVVSKIARAFLKKKLEDMTGLELERLN